MRQLRDLLSDYNKARNKVAVLCKYESDSTEVIKGLFRDHLIRFTQPYALNDPMEVNPNLSLDFGDDEINHAHYVYQDVILPSYKDWVYMNLIEARYNLYGILSLTREPFSYQMWNLYANAHKGFILEFKKDFNEKDCFKSEDLFSGDVDYVENYELKVPTRMESSGFEGYDYLNRELFLKKTIHWKNEREYRIIRPLSEHPKYVRPRANKAYRDDRPYLFSYDPSCINTIIFGAAMAPEKKRLIIELTSDLNIPYMQSLMDKSDNFELYYLQITSWPRQEAFLSMQPQQFMTSETEFRYIDQYKAIQTLAEIPYFKEKTISVSIMKYLRTKGVKTFKGL